jgi:hypothetical protein
VAMSAAAVAADTDTPYTHSHPVSIDTADHSVVAVRTDG